MDNNTEKASELAGEASEHIVDAVEDVKATVSEIVTDESIQNIKEKATEFTNEAKEVLDDVTEKASELVGEASEHIVDFAEDAQEEIKETTTKTKNFFQRLFKK
jgi:methyl-accepting chemotaxis protein